MHAKVVSSLTAVLTLSTFIGTSLIPAALATENNNNAVTPANLPVVTTDASGHAVVNDSPSIMNNQEIISQTCPASDSPGSKAISAVPRIVENNGRSYELVWNDEFCGNMIDRTRWRPSQEPENGRMHYVNIEGEESNPESTVWVKDGAIHLRANHDEHEYETKRIDPKTGEKIKRTVPVKSTNLSTQGLSAWKYGRFEVRLKTTAEPGTWPAFWLLPQRSAAGWPRDGEIDWFENIGDSPNSNFTSVHSSTLPHLSIRSRDDSAKSAAVNLENGKYQGGGQRLDEFHVWTMEWDENEFRFYVDDHSEPYGVINRWDNRWMRNNGTVNNPGMPGPFNTPFYFIMNLAYGGWASLPQTNGKFDPSKTDFTKTMQVDYLRVYQTKDQQEQQNQVYLVYNNGGYGEDIKTTFHSKGDIVDSLPVLEAPLADFQGWYLNEKLTIPAPEKFKIMSDTTLFAKWELKPITAPKWNGATNLNFSDLKATDLFYSEISWLAQSGITTGYKDGTFRPYQSISREAMAAFLYRLNGSPKFTAPVISPFYDVHPSDLFYKEICWLAQTGITTGYPDKTFRPQKPISRAAMVAFLYRYASKYPQHTTLATDPRNHPEKVNDAFKDVKYMQKNRQNLMQPLPATLFHKEITWAAHSGITTGYKDGSFQPWDPINRNAMAVFIYRLKYNTVK